MVQLPRGKGGPQIIVYHWPRNNSVGHVSIQIGELYLSNVPLPRSIDKGVLLSTRTNVKGFEPSAKVRVEKRNSVSHRTLKCDLDEYGESPVKIMVPADRVNVLDGLRFASETIRGHEYVRPNKVLPYFDLKGATFRPVPPKMYYQIADSAEGKGDASNCATTTAGALAAMLSADESDVIKEFKSVTCQRSLCRPS